MLENMTQLGTRASNFYFQNVIHFYVATPPTTHLAECAFQPLTKPNHFMSCHFREITQSFLRG